LHGADFYAHTAEVYRLWALESLDPPRPALQRVLEGGAAVEVEIWSLDLPSLGALVREVSSPLAVGEVQLSDGRRVTGFVCEPAGLGGARDITSFGGWRAFLELSRPASGG
jgi:allophanate hydrolase